MRKSFLAVVIVGGLAVVGCTRDDELKREHEMTNDKVMSTQPAMKGGAHGEAKGAMSGKMAADACSHCEGVQTATADGKCPMCGMKVQ